MLSLRNPHQLSEGALVIVHSASISTNSSNSCLHTLLQTSFASSELHPSPDPPHPNPIAFTAAPLTLPACLPDCANGWSFGPEIRRNRSRFRNLLAAEVTRLKHSEDQSLLTSAATVLKEPYMSQASAPNEMTQMCPPAGYGCRQHSFRPFPCSAQRSFGKTDASLQKPRKQCLATVREGAKNHLNKPAAKEILFEPQNVKKANSY